MARFYLSAINGRGQTQSIGGRASIESAHVRGWHAGVEIDCIGVSDGTDRFEIYMTPGSTGAGHRVLLGTVDAPAGKPPKWRPAKGRKSVVPPAVRRTRPPRMYIG